MKDEERRWRETSKRMRRGVQTQCIWKRNNSQPCSLLSDLENPSLLSMFVKASCSHMTFILFIYFFLSFFPLSLSEEMTNLLFLFVYCSFFSVSIDRTTFIIIINYLLLTFSVCGPYIRTFDSHSVIGLHIYMHVYLLNVN